MFRRRPTQQERERYYRSLGSHSSDLKPPVKIKSGEAHVIYAAMGGEFMRRRKNELRKKYGDDIAKSGAQARKEWDELWSSVRGRPGL